MRSNKVCTIHTYISSDDEEFRRTDILYIALFLEKKSMSLSIYLRLLLRLDLWETAIL